MKTLLDRLNPLYPSDYRFRKIYMLMTAAEEVSLPATTEAVSESEASEFHSTEQKSPGE